MMEAESGRDVNRLR